MKFYFRILERAFRSAIVEALGPLESTEENPLGDKFIDCSPIRFIDALFVVKRFHQNTVACQRHVMNTDEFEVRWRTFFADFDNPPLRHEKAPRQQIKYANQILVESMYGAEVADGMEPKAFEPSMAVCFMNCIADASDSIRWDRNLLIGILNRGLEIYPALELKTKLEERLEKKESRPTVKV